MKKLFMVLGFLILLLSSLSARYIFDDNIVFTSHATAKDSIAYFCIEKAGGVIDTFMIVDTLGNVTIIEVQSGFFFQELYQSAGEYRQVASGSNGYFYGGFTTLSSDSLFFDSLRVVWKTDHNDVYIDSVAVIRGITRTAYDNTLIMGDGTDYGAGNTNYVPVTYAVGITISYDWRLKMQYWVETSATAGNGMCYSAKAYFHYE